MKKKIVSYLPEMLFGGGALYSCIMYKTFYPLLIIVLVAILMLWKNREFALILASIIVVIGLYLILALWSELSEFTTQNADYWKMFLVGHLLLISIIITAVFMPIKYFKMKFND